MPINDFGNVGAKTANIDVYDATFVECQLCTASELFQVEKSCIQSEETTPKAR